MRPDRSVAMGFAQVSDNLTVYVESIALNP
jgi:hypothetical protein